MLRANVKVSKKLSPDYNSTEFGVTRTPRGPEHADAERGTQFVEITHVPPTRTRTMPC